LASKLLALHLRPRKKPRKQLKNKVLKTKIYYSPPTGGINLSDGPQAATGTRRTRRTWFQGQNDGSLSRRMCWCQR